MMSKASKEGVTLAGAVVAALAASACCIGPVAFALLERLDIAGCDPKRVLVGAEEALDWLQR